MTPAPKIMVLGSTSVSSLEFDLKFIKDLNPPLDQEEVSAGRRRSSFPKLVYKSGLPSRTTSGYPNTKNGSPAKVGGILLEIVYEQE